MQDVADPPPCLLPRSCADLCNIPYSLALLPEHNLRAICGTDEAIDLPHSKNPHYACNQGGLSLHPSTSPSHAPCCMMTDLSLLQDLGPCPYPIYI